MSHFFKKILFLLLFCGTFNISLSQEKIITELIDNSLNEYTQLFSVSSDYNLIISLPRKLEGLKPYFIDYFRNKFHYKNNNSENKIILVVNDASASYTLIDGGFFGDDFIERNLIMSGMLIYPEKSGFVDASFSGTVKDTILYDDYAVNHLLQLPVEQGELPYKTKFKDFLQPVIIVATLITSVILLFTVRSN
ncbi:hypothetical protein [Melioribacter sp. OK-6-Me]|uniref:hypothetical protein n=1 Tax=unclassified Melioribacter TaxID=2627329 RepID=UPI003EDA64F4